MHRTQVLQELIEKTGMNLKAFSRKAGVPYTTLRSMLSKPLGNAAVDNVIKVCQALGITVNDLERMATASDVLGLYALSPEQLISIPIVGQVRCGEGYLAQEEVLGHELTDMRDINGGDYFYLRVQGDSMTGEGIFQGDLALIRKQPDVENGDLAVALVDGEEGTLKRVYRNKDSLVLQAANPAYPPRTFVGSDMARVQFVGKVKMIKRKF